jgi:excinuclease UvrABC ATPase subunit
VVAGTPEDVAGHAGSYTGQFLKHTLEHLPVEQKQAVPA